MNKSFIEYLTIIKSKWKIGVIGILIGIICSLLYTFLISEPVYKADVKIFIGKEKFKNVFEEYSNEEILMYQRLMKTHSELINTKDLLNSAIKISGYDLELGEVRKNLSTLPITDTQILALEYKSNSSQKAYDILYEITNVYIKTIAKLYPNINISVLQQPYANTSPISKGLAFNTIIGLLAGIVVSLAIIILQEMMNNTFNKKEELENYIGINVIGIIPTAEE